VLFNCRKLYWVVLFVSLSALFVCLFVVNQLLRVRFKLQPVMARVIIVGKSAVARAVIWSTYLALE
jgi:hypothetical protein